MESMRKKRKSASVSAVLDELIAQHRRRQEASRISASITNYYDSMTEDEMAEESLWGQFAETQHPDQS